MTRRRTQETGVVKGWEEKQDAGAFQRKERTKEGKEGRKNDRGTEGETQHPIPGN